MGSSKKEISSDTKFDARIQDWKRKLVDLSRRNKLLFFVPSRSSSLQVQEPTLTEVFNQLVVDEKPWKFFIPPVEEEKATSPTFLRKSDELLCNTHESISNVLKNMYRRSRSDFEERGVRILYVTFGIFQWQEMEHGDTVHSPLILFPVELRRKSAIEPFELHHVEGDAILNPVLQVRLLNDFNTELPEPEDWEIEAIDNYFVRVAEAFKGKKWILLPECWISLLSFYKLPIYEDLNRNTKIIRQHPVVRALAGEEVKEAVSGNPTDPKLLDTTVNPRQSYLVLDADSSQLACIESVKNGSNLVVQGPPGTGKSQIIVNLVAEFVSRGKTVLFVSEKMAALEVVYKRIRDRGLGYFCLELHSHKTNKRLVVEELHSCYLEQLQPGKVMSEAEFRQLEERRKILNDYVEALHRIREPLQLSAYQVLSKLANLKGAPFVSPGSVNPATLEPDQFDLAVRLAKRLGQVWNVVVEGERFPWRGSRTISYGMGIHSTYQKYVNTCLETLLKARESGVKFAVNLGFYSPASIADVNWLLMTLEHLGRCPAIPSGLLAKRDSDPFEYLRSAEVDRSKWTFARIACEYNWKIIESFDLDRLIRIHSSPFRWLCLTYYRSRKQIKEVRLDGTLPKSIIEDLKCANELKNAVEWVVSFRNHLGERVASTRLLEIVETGTKVAPNPTELIRAAEEFQEAFTELESQFETGYPQLGGVYLRNMLFEPLEARLREIGERVDALREWVDYKKLKEDFQAAGLQVLFDNIVNPFFKPEGLPDIVQRALLEVWLDWLFEKEPALGQFRGQQHEQLIEEFRELDRKLWKLGTHRVIIEANKHRPQITSYSGSEGQVLLREAMKKRRHLPLRKLFAQIPNLLTRLKPCLLMSPLTVSQFLDPQLISFDLVIFDEASQVRTEDAISAIYRGRQLTVCGDDKQLPPTTFFEQGMSEEFDEETEGAFDVYENVLKELVALGMPQGWLRWHYRSRHESLIAFSNSQFYGNRLVTFPCSVDKDPQLGVKFVHVPDGVYDRGGKRDNMREAEKVVELVADHFKRFPEKSLGVVAFSIAQANTIEDHIEQLRKERPELEQHFKEDRLEGFFVKNLETVQGDERDVLIFSIGYARDQQGRLTMHFGPLNHEGGEKRLNVAVTRAREKVIVVSSIRAADFDLSAKLPSGVLQLQKYLDYAERGKEALNIKALPFGDFESPLEADVASEIRALGYEVMPQVGCSDYRIDLGVVDPVQPGHFILGVECDGATYHSSYTARDRDRLRQEVLEKLGWQIHRIWAPDWVTRRDTEVHRLREAIEQARHSSSVTTKQPKASEDQGKAIEPRTTQVNTPTSNDSDPSIHWTIHYKKCMLRTRPTRGIDFYSLSATRVLVQMLREVVDVEGPLHIEEAARRLAHAWGLQRIGSRIMGVVNSLIRYLLQSSAVKKRGDFLWPASPAFHLKVRRPDPNDLTTMRSIELIPPEEVELAFINVLRDALSLPRDALLLQVAKIFGFEYVGDKIQKGLEGILDGLICQGHISDKGDRLAIQDVSNFRKK